MMFNMEAKSSGNRARAAVWGANKLGVVLGAALVSVVIIVPVVLLLAVNLI